MLSPHKFSYTTFDSISEKEKPNLIHLTSQDYSPVGGQLDAPALWNFFSTTKPGRWVVKYGSTPIGLSALSPLPEVGGFYQTGTYIFSKYRGKGYNPILKKTTLAAFNANPNAHKLGAVIKEWNVRSQKAMKNVFPDIEPGKLFFSPEDAKKYGGEYQYFYDYSSYPGVDLSEYFNTSVYQTIFDWATEHFQTTYISVNAETPVVISELAETKISK